MANDHSIPRARKQGLIVQEVEDEVLIYDIERKQAHALNSTAALVWKSCDGKRTVSEIQQQASRQVGSSTNASIVWYALEQLDKYQLLEASEQPPVARSGITRREFITKFALAAAVVPLVKSIKVPGPSQNGSCVAWGGPCDPVTGPFCCPGQHCALFAPPLQPVCQDAG